MLSSLENNLEHKNLSGFILGLVFGFATTETKGLTSLISKLYLSPFFKFNYLHLRPFLKTLKKKNQSRLSILLFGLHYSPSLAKKLCVDHLYFIKLSTLKLFIISLIILAITPHKNFNIGILITIFYWFTIHLIENEIWIYRFSFLILTTLSWQTILDLNFSIAGFIFGQLFFLIYSRIILYLITSTLLLIFFKLNFLENLYLYLYRSFIFINKLFIHFETSSTLLLFLIIVFCIFRKNYSLIILFFVFKSDWVFAPAIYYLK